jgi:hypothetical protein
MHNVDKQIEQWRNGLAESELLRGSDVGELESHLRDEMGHLKTSGLSAEEAFLVARRRLGDTAALAEEFAKVSPHRHLTNRLSWMATGVLAYLFLSKLSECVTYASTQIGYAVGLRHAYLALLACAAQVLAFAGIGVLMWRCIIPDSPSQATTRRAPIWVGAVLSSLFAACWVVAVWWIKSFYHVYLMRTMPRPTFRVFMEAQSWAKLGWAMLIPFLAAGLIAFLTIRDRRQAAIPQA